MAGMKFLLVEGGCSACLLARHPSLIEKEKRWNTTQFPYCVKLVIETKDYTKSKIVCGEGEFDEKCPLLTLSAVKQMEEPKEERG